MIVRGHEIIIVIPCYNEVKRIHKKNIDAFLKQNQNAKILFVNDGSLDGTGEVLRDLCTRNAEHLLMLDLEQNVGKAEAVRLGFLKAFSMAPTFVAMWDADLSTPLTEVNRFHKLMIQNQEILLVMGSRVKLLGRNITRSSSRHILGRLSATLISLALKLDVYDSQCGAKLFRVTSLTKEIFSSPFQSTWIFDVELIARIINANRNDPSRSTSIYELPLNEWKEVRGSKIKPYHYLKCLVELIRIRIRYF